MSQAAATIGRPQRITASWTSSSVARGVDMASVDGHGTIQPPGWAARASVSCPRRVRCGPRARAASTGTGDDRDER